MPFGGHPTLTDALRAHWSFENDPTDMLDDTPNGNDLANTNSASFASDSNVETYSIDLDTTSKKLTRANASLTHLVPSGDFTIAGWIKLADSTAVDRILLSQYPNDGGISFGNSFMVRVDDVSSNMKLNLFASDDGFTDTNVVGLRDIPDSTWVFIDCGLNTGSGHLWANTDRGVSQIASVATAGANPSSSEDFVIGGYSDSDTSIPWRGKVDQIGIWHRALSDSELDDLYNSGDGLAYSENAPASGEFNIYISGGGSTPADVDVYVPGAGYSDTLTFDDHYDGDGKNIHRGNIDNNEWFNRGYYDFNELGGSLASGTDGNIAQYRRSSDNAIMPANWNNVYRNPDSDAFYQQYRNVIAIEASGATPDSYQHLDFNNNIDMGAGDFSVFLSLFSNDHNIVAGSETERMIFFMGASGDPQLTVTHEPVLGQLHIRGYDVSLNEYKSSFGALLSRYGSTNMVINYIETGASGQISMTYSDAGSQGWATAMGDILILNRPSDPIVTIGGVRDSFYDGFVPSLSNSRSLKLHECGFASSGINDTQFIKSRVGQENYLTDGTLGVNWKVPTGSGATEHSTSYTHLPFETVNSNFYHMLGPHQYKNLDNQTVDLFPSSVYFNVTADHHTSHSGVWINPKFKIYDDATLIATYQTDILVPSGTGQSLTGYAQPSFPDDAFPIDINRDLTSTLSLRTYYTNSETYYGDLNISSLSTSTESWMTPGFASGAFDFYTYGNWPTANVDLFVYNQYTAEDIDLYTMGKDSLNNNISLYQVSHLSDSGNFDLYTKATFAEDMPLYVAGREYVTNSGNFDLFTYSATNSAMYNTRPLMVKGVNFNPAHTLNFMVEAGGLEMSSNMNVYVFNDNSYSNSFDMYVKNGVSGTNDSMTLYMPSSGNPLVTNDMPLFISREFEGSHSALSMYTSGPSGVSDSSTPMYVNGRVLTTDSFNISTSGNHTPNSSFNLYSHGF